MVRPVLEEGVRVWMEGPTWRVGQEIREPRRFSWRGFMDGVVVLEGGVVDLVWVWFWFGVGETSISEEDMAGLREGGG